jgi:AcrR family transcriptional regulator
MPPASAPTGRSEILRVALQLFAERGYRGASTAAIARAAGVTQPLVHHHFGSKDGLWQAVVADALSDLRAALLSAVPPGGPPSRARVRALIQAFVRFIGARPEVSRLIHTESSGGGPQYDHLYAHGLGEMIDFFRHELEQAIAAGVLRPVAPAHAYSLLIGASTQPFMVPQTVQRAFGVDVQDPAFVAGYQEAVVDTLLAGLGAGKG